MGKSVNPLFLWLFLIDMIDNDRCGVVSHRKMKPPLVPPTAPQEGRVQQPGVLQAALRRRGAAGGGAVGGAAAEGDGRSRVPGPPEATER